MGPDAIQIGGMAISRTAWDTIAPLIGVLIGGAISYFAMWSLENRRWERERKHKIKSERREALAVALEWLDPMERAISSASMIVSSFLQHNIEHEELMTRWPRLLTDLSKKDVPPRLKLFLPKDIYERGNLILREMDDLRYMAIKCGVQGKLKNMPFYGWDTCFPKLSAIEKMIASLHNDLEERYKATFD
jgi:hypothetical protein